MWKFGLLLLGEHAEGTPEDNDRRLEYLRIMMLQNPDNVISSLSLAWFS